MSHLFRKDDFHIGQRLTLVHAAAPGSLYGDESRTPVTVVGIKFGTTGKMKGVLKVTVQRPDYSYATVLPRPDARFSTLEPC